MVLFENDKGKIVYNNSEFHFLRFGNGPRILLAFHGFGLSKESFLITEKKLGTAYTVYSFDLFFHGESYWAHKERPLSKVTFAEMMRLFLDHFGIRKFSIITYSLGGKLGLSLAEAYVPRLEKLMMVASDGFVLSPWYKLATSFAATRRLLKWFVFKPQLYFKVTQLLHRMKVIPYATIRFAELNMSTITLRRKVYLSWVVFRKLKVDTDALCRQLNHHQIDVELYFGDRDFLIPMRKIKQRSSTLIYRQVVVFACSHSKVLQEYAYHDLKADTSA